VPFGEWKPDLSLLDTQFASIADNVFATLNSYQPIPSLQAITHAMLGDLPALGLFPVRRKDGTWEIYAGTRHKLWKWSFQGWTDVSRTTGGSYNVPGGELWSAVQFGTTLIAVQFGDVPQAIDVETGTNFSALGGSPPQAHNVQVIGDFVVLGGLAEGSTIAGMPTDRRMMIWCGINNPTNWVPGNGLCDFQLFPDGGPVQGVAGNETVAYVVQDRGIRLMQFLPGDINTIFNFTKILHDRGAVGEFCFRTVGDVFYFINEDGFYALAGSQLLPIGQDKANQWLMLNSDRQRRNLYQIVPTNRPYVAWAFYATTASQNYDRIIIYNWANQRFTTGTINALVWALLGSHFIDLDTDTDTTITGDQFLDSGANPGPPAAAAPPPAFFAPPPQTRGASDTPPSWGTNQTPLALDSFAYVGGRPIVCGINQLGELCSLDGPNLPATVETAETHLAPGMRAFVNEVYPLIDGADATVGVAIRERLGDPPVWAISGQIIDSDPRNPVPGVDQIPLEITGAASVLTSSRLHRFRVLIPYGEVWNNAMGVLADAQPDGSA